MKPFIEQRADPYILRHTDGRYYFTASVPEYDRIVLRTADDLFHIRTLGFRGEALAAIAAVSKLRIMTKPAGAEFGTLMRNAQETIDTFIRGKSEQEVAESVSRMKREADRMRSTARRAAASRTSPMRES